MNLVSREKAIDVAIDEYNRGYKEGFEAGKASVSAQPEIIRCKDCKHRPLDGEDTQGSGIEFPDGICPCQCEDFWYSWRPDDDWFCANADMRGDTE